MVGEKSKKQPKGKSGGNGGLLENEANQQSGTFGTISGNAEKEPSLKEKQILKEMDQIEQLIRQGFSEAMIGIMLGMPKRTLIRRVVAIRAQNSGDEQGHKDTGFEYLRRFKYAGNQAWIVKSGAKSDRDKLHAIEVAMAGWRDEIKILQTLGLFPKEPQVGDERTPMTVIFKHMPRPDRSKQMAELAKKSTEKQN